MANEVSLNHVPNYLLGGTIDVEVISPLVGKSIFDSLRRKFSTSGQMESGDYFMDRSRELLRRHLQLIELDQQDTIRQQIDGMRDIKNDLENFRGSALKKYRMATDYERESRVTYRIVKRASERGMEGRLMNQIAEEMQRHRGGSGSGSGTVASIPRDPFTDSHAISSLTNVSVVDLDRVEMSTFQDTDNGEAAVVLDLVAQDQSVQHIVATFPTEAFSGDGTDRGGEMLTSPQAYQSIAPEAHAALSLYRDDGTMVRFIAASSADVSQNERANDSEGGETRSITSVISSDGILRASNSAEMPY